MRQSLTKMGMIMLFLRDDAAHWRSAFDGVDACVSVVATLEEAFIALLPEAARNYLARIAELVGVSPGLISWGPSRSETILISNPFLEASTN